MPPLVIGALKSTKCQGRSVVQRLMFGPSSTRLNPQPPRASQPPHHHFSPSSPFVVKFLSRAAGLRVAFYPLSTFFVVHSSLVQHSELACIGSALTKFHPGVGLSICRQSSFIAFLSSLLLPLAGDDVVVVQYPFVICDSRS